jgi:phospholipase D1/2
LLWLTIWGRWDTPQHALVDDPEEGEEPIWPGDADVQSSHYEQGADDIVGKDYSNARITDFHTLAKPEEDMHDRARTPRMPW